MTSPRIKLDDNNEVELTGLQSKPGVWGLLWYHRNPETGEQCIGGITWDPERAYHWDLVSLDPLTVSPSLLCLTCKCHGFIRDGKWVPA